MADAKRCDRCRYYYDIGAVRVGPKYLSLHVHGEYQPRPQALDLCQTCHDELTAWFLTRKPGREAPDGDKYLRHTDG